MNSNSEAWCININYSITIVHAEPDVFEYIFLEGFQTAIALKFEDWDRKKLADCPVLKGYEVNLNN